MPKNIFATDAELEKKGVRHDFPNAAGDLVKDGSGAMLKGFFVQVAAAGGHNRAYLQRLEAVRKPFLYQIQHDLLSQEQKEEIAMRSFFGPVVTAWGGEVGPNGEALEFTEANFVQNMKALPRLWAFIQEKALGTADFKLKETEAVVAG